MDTTIGVLLVLGKWLLIGLVYLILFLVLAAVRREMRQHLAAEATPAAAAPGRLKVVQGGTDPRLQPGQLFTLGSQVLLGADAGQIGKGDLLVQDRFVSGRHARLTWDGTSWWVVDLGSTNGTMVNGRAAAQHQREALPPGGTLQVGDVLFELLE
jgi:hypothetical protein